MRKVASSGTTLAEADIPSLTVAGKVDGGAINAGTIGGSAAINSSGNIVTSGTVSANTVSGNNLRVYDGQIICNFQRLHLVATPILFCQQQMALPIRY